jgi:hypothetical protein
MLIISHYKIKKYFLISLIQNMSGSIVVEKNKFLWFQTSRDNKYQYKYLIIYIHVQDNLEI